MRFIRALAIGASLFLLSLASATAQVPDNCEMSRVSDPDRHVLRCAGSLVIELDAATRMGYVNSTEGPPSRITVHEGAALIDVVPGSAAPQVRTPHAIAAVRGTVYAVDVGADSSAVFVLRGEVNVRHKNGVQGPVVVGPGQGVDVAPGETLEVRTWSQDRVDGLLSRFGR